jgi:hypothetical protein
MCVSVLIFVCVLVLFGFIIFICNDLPFVQVDDGGIIINDCFFSSQPSVIFDGNAIVLSGGAKGSITINQTRLQDVEMYEQSLIFAEKGEGLIISNSVASNIKTEGNGSVLYSAMKTVIRNSKINGTSAGGNGGALYFDSTSDFELLYDVIENCVAVKEGGAIYIAVPASQPERRRMVFVEFRGNRAANNQTSGNDIRDVEATEADWFSRVSDCCSTSARTRFSCGAPDALGAVPVLFDGYMMSCDATPCVDLNWKTGMPCPRGCEEYFGCVC